MQEFKQETIWGSFIALDLHKVKIIHHNCFLWPSGSKTRLFTWMAACSGETDANPELRNLLIRLCIPVLQITWYPYQEGSWGTQFKNPGLRGGWGRNSFLVCACGNGRWKLNAAFVQNSTGRVTKVGGLNPRAVLCCILMLMYELSTSL